MQPGALFSSRDDDKNKKNVTAPAEIHLFATIPYALSRPSLLYLNRDVLSTCHLVEHLKNVLQTEFLQEDFLAVELNQDGGSITHA